MLWEPQLVHYLLASPSAELAMPDVGLEPEGTYNLSVEMVPVPQVGKIRAAGHILRCACVPKLLARTAGTRYCDLFKSASPLTICTFDLPKVIDAFIDAKYIQIIPSLPFNGTGRLLRVSACESGVWRLNLTIPVLRPAASSCMHCARHVQGIA